MADDVTLWSATRLAAAIKAKELSSRELLDAFLTRIARVNPTINAVVTIDEEGARAYATAADEATAHGEAVGPLHGLPTTIKDAIEVGGMRSTGGAVELTDHVPQQDAPVVAAVRAAGAYVIGKTNCPRWSGDLQSFNEIFGTTNNPWDVTRAPGGSSGGAAASVAAGFTSFEIGTDIGGSVRIPSHFCGVFGLKPSFGVVPQHGYLDHVGGGTTDADINVFGPIARSVDDLSLLFDVIAGPPPEDEVAWRLDLPAARHRELGGYRVATWLDDSGCRIDDEYHGLLQGAADAIADSGAKVNDTHPPVDFGEQLAVFFAMVGAAIVPSFPNDLGDATGGTHRQWLVHEKHRARLRATWAEWFTEHDVLLCPVTPTPAILHDQEGEMFSRTMTINGESRGYLDNIAWTGLIGVLGLPSCVVPIGRTKAGLPVGVQIVAPYLRDRDALRVAELIGEVITPVGLPAL